MNNTIDMTLNDTAEEFITKFNAENDRLRALQEESERDWEYESELRAAREADAAAELYWSGRTNAAYGAGDW
jgi:benzoyl-CoA reductase/2-hydroxyglutaryl-CoA dehydratase subunit BcrC/BadD/HgdB